MKEGANIVVLEAIDRVKDREEVAIEGQKAAQSEAKNIVKSARDEAKMLVENAVMHVKAETEARISRAKNISQESLENNLKKVDDEVKKMLDTVQARKKVAIQSVIELVID